MKRESLSSEKQGGQTIIFLSGRNNMGRRKGQQPARRRGAGVEHFVPSSGSENHLLRVMTLVLLSLFSIIFILEKGVPIVCNEISGHTTWQAEESERKELPPSFLATTTTTDTQGTIAADTTAASSNDSLANVAFSKLELFLSTFPGNPEDSVNVNGFAEVQSTLVRSLEFFWPRDNLRMTVALDNTVYSNEPELRGMTSRVKSLFAEDVQEQVSVVYNPRTNKTLYGTGWYIQQLIMFWADNFTSSDYIGFVDDDTLFTRAVNALELFDERGRPRVIAKQQYGNPDWYLATEYAFQRKPLIDAMAYFPVIIKREHHTPE
jgi:hypothetical protein